MKSDRSDGHRRHAPNVIVHPAAGRKVPRPVKDGQRVLAGIRPEHIHHASNGPITANVDVVEPIGHETIVYASSGDSKLVAIFEPTVTPRAADTIAMSVDIDAMHLFDAGSENSVL